MAVRIETHHHAGGFIAYDDDALKGIVPPSYYQTSFQAPAFTRQQWSPYFDVVEYREGSLAFQDVA